MVTLRARIEAEGSKWWKWQSGKFGRTRKDMEKLMRMARADDPEAAAQAEREGTRLRMTRSRAAVERTVRSTSDVDHILYAVRALTDDQRADTLY